MSYTDHTNFCLNKDLIILFLNPSHVKIGTGNQY